MKCPLCKKLMHSGYFIGDYCPHERLDFCNAIVKTLEYINDWVKPIPGTETAPMEKEEILHIKKLLEGKA